MLSSMDLSAIQQAWERYVAGPEPVPDQIPGVRQEIVDSWRRSKGKVDPFEPEKTVSSGRLQKLKQENMSLIRIARPYLQNLFQYLRESGHQITIVDRNSCILDTIFDDTANHERPPQFRISNGSLFSEEEAGTNGIALCRHLKKPISVFGPEHFKQCNHNSICYTAPIYDQFQNLIGFVDISGPIDGYQPSIMGMLRSSVQGIEREFLFRQTNAVLTSALDAFTAGILVVNADKRIIYHNSKARSILRVGGDTLIGQPIYSVLRQDSLPVPAQGLNQKIFSMECTILNRYHVPLDVDLSVIPSDGAGGMQITLIKLDPQSELARLAYRGNDFTAHYTFDSILGESPAVQSIKAMGMVAATTSLPVMIFGESGTGKEVLAQAIHNTSERADGPFVSLDCSKIPRALLESELFGYEGGVFRGGKENGYMGRFEQANGGTLFLNEVSYLPQDAQEALVQILQNGTVTRLGGKYPKTVSFKLIVATTVNLLTAVQRKAFRADLYYRLNALSITIPPLRERREDILPIANHFIEEHCFKAGKAPVSLEPEAADALYEYDWPNNIREVEAVMEDTLHLVEGSVIALNDLPTSLLSSYYASRAKKEGDSGKSNPETSEPGKGSGEKQPSLAQSSLEEYQKVLDVVRANGGNTKLAAAALQLPLSTLYYKMKKFGIHPKDYKN